MSAVKKPTRSKTAHYGKMDKGYTRWAYLKVGYDMLDGTDSHWIDEEEIKVCWENYKNKIMAEYTGGRESGRRPWAWWKFEKGMAKPKANHWDDDTETDLLWEMGELTSPEAVAAYEDMKRKRQIAQKRKELEKK
jgi:hypothetical protein